jgi:hypothetical protein
MEVLMSKRVTAAVTAAVATLALSVPSVGFATNGGVPHSTQACPAHSHMGKHKGAGHGKTRGAAKGKKCGTR